MKTKYKVTIKNPQRMIEFTKLNDFANWSSEFCRPLYNAYCRNLEKTIKSIKETNKDFVIEIELERI